jgi:CP family cyanate transporter-like MFS transporter
VAAATEAVAARIQRRPGDALLLVGILLVAVNLRPVITATGPLIGEIQADLGLTAAGAGLLGSLPVLCFGLFSVLAPRAGHRFGLEEVLMVAMLVLTAGVLLRVVPTITALFVGTAVLGVSIAFANVLMPAMVRRTYPVTGKRMSGIYVTVIVASATFASAIAIPLSNAGLGWQGALGIWAIPALVAALVWAVILRRRSPSKIEVPKRLGFRVLLRSKLALAVMAFMAAQAFAIYIMLFWLTQILIDSGVEQVQAGLIFAFAQLCGLLPVIALSFAGDRIADDRYPVLAGGTVTIVGLAGLLAFGSEAALLWAILIMVGQGSGFALGLSFFVSRSASHSISAELSGIGQSFAYLVAATGPVLAGVMRDASESWSPVIALVIGVIVLQVIAGLEAGRPARIGD